MVFTHEGAAVEIGRDRSYAVTGVRYTALNVNGKEIHAYLVFDNIGYDQAALREFHRLLGEALVSDTGGR